MTALISLSDDDVPPADSESTENDTAPLRCEIDGCHNTLTYSGRGRRPKRCDEHKRNTGDGKRSSGNWSRANEVENALSKYVDGIAFGIKMIHPADGEVIAVGGPAIAHELVELGRIDKTWRKTLERCAAPGKYGPLTLASLGVLLPIMVNHGLLPQFQIPTDSGKGEPV